MATQMLDQAISATAEQWTNEDQLPEGIFSLLDTDLYKLTMQCAVLQHYPDADVTYRFTNRTPDLRLNRKAYEWLKIQIEKLSTLALSPPERVFLHEKCPYLPEIYVSYLAAFRFKPTSQISVTFDGGPGPTDLGTVGVNIKGKWVETILYEIPLLVLVSETYFRFVDTAWNYDGQEEKAYQKGKTWMDSGIMFSEFGTRRRRSYKAHDVVLQGLMRAAETAGPGASGKLTGSSNVHFAHRYNIPPIGTVAHEWFMGIAALTNDYKAASTVGLAKWVETFGVGVLGIALTDTFGTQAFLEAFADTCHSPTAHQKSFAEVFAGVRQDSGDPEDYVKWMRTFYDNHHIMDKKTIVFSDSLNMELVLKYKKIADEYGFISSFGVGTFLTNDFVNTETGKKSTPLNIVIKISSAGGSPAVKISDNIGKNTGDEETVRKVKEILGYMEHGEVVDESHRWT